MTHQKDFEFELIKLWTGQEEFWRLEEIKIDSLAQKVQTEKKNLYFNDELLWTKEAEIREKENF